MKIILIVTFCVNAMSYYLKKSKFLRMFKLSATILLSILRVMEKSEKNINSFVEINLFFPDL